MWQSRDIQVVWFPVTEIDGKGALNIYKSLLDKEPDGFENHRILQPQAPYFGRAYGQNLGIIHQVTVRPGRVDWQLEPFPDEDTDPFSNLFETQPTLKKINKMIQNMDGKLIGEVTRISVVSKLLQPQDSPEKAQNNLLKLCKIDLVAKDLSDLMIHINKTKFISNTVVINRLVKYSIANAIEIKVDSTTGEPIEHHKPSNVIFGTVVNLDFNTVPSGQIYKTKEQRKIFDKLIDETTNFAKNPDVGFFENRGLK